VRCDNAWDGKRMVHARVPAFGGHGFRVIPGRLRRVRLPRPLGRVLEEDLPVSLAPSVAAPLRTRARGTAASAGARLARHAGTICLRAQMLDRAWLDLCQNGGFSTYQAWSQLSYATIRLDPLCMPPSARPLVDTVTRRSRARARLSGPAAGGDEADTFRNDMFRTLSLPTLTCPVSRCRFKSLRSMACLSGRRPRLATHRIRAAPRPAAPAGAAAEGRAGNGRSRTRRREQDALAQQEGDSSAAYGACRRRAAPVYRAPPRRSVSAQSQSSCLQISVGF